MHSANIGNMPRHSPSLENGKGQSGVVGWRWVDKKIVTKLSEGRKTRKRDRRRKIQGLVKEWKRKERKERKERGKDFGRLSCD